MGAPTSSLPAPDTLPGLLLTLTALAGEFPTSLVHRLPGSDSYKEAAVKRLKREKLLRTYYHDGLRGLRLTATAKRLLLSARPDLFSDIFSGSTVTNTPKYTVPHRLRLHRMAEVLVTMMQARVPSFPWEKSAVFQSEPPPAGFCASRPAYYSSREVKEIGPQSSKIRGSRATGVLLTESGIFVVYNIGASKTKWEYKAELRMKALLQIEICQRRLSAQYADLPVNAVVFGQGLKPLEHLMGPGDRASRNYFVLDGSFDHFYYLTSDHHGEVMLRLLWDNSLKSDLDTILSEDLLPWDRQCPVEHDALDAAGTPVLFGYLGDMPRIRRFDTALELHERSGILICFDFQEAALRRSCGRRVQFQCIDFDAFEGSVCHIT